MKIIRLLTIFISIVSIILFSLILFNKNQEYPIISGSDEIMSSSFYEDPLENLENKYLEIENKVVPYIVNANVKIDGNIITCEVIEDKGNGKSYHIKYEKTDKWVNSYYVTILQIDELKLSDLTDEEIEIYVNYNNFTSKTDYFIWVDIYRNQTYILKKENDFFFMFKRFDCSTGANITPTKRGLYEIVSKGDYFYSRDNTYVCYNYLKYSGSYLLHSFPYSFDGKVLDDRLNERVSNGCVRYELETIKYIYDLIDINTTIFLN